jgi:carbonic anhydrase
MNKEILHQDPPGLSSHDYESTAMFDYFNFPSAYIIRSGGANLRYSAFKVSYAIAVGNIRHIAIIAHNNCGMVNLHSRKSQFINGLVENPGWDKERTEEHFMRYAPMFEIGDEIDFAISEAKRLRSVYPGITVVPLLYRVEDNLLYLLEGE